jgi:hypothetical protein
VREKQQEKKIMASPSFSAGGPSVHHRRTASLENNNKPEPPPQYQHIEAFKVPGVVGSSSSSAFWVDLAFKLLVIALVAGMGVVIGVLVNQSSKIKSQQTELKQLESNNTAINMQLNEILMDMGHNVNETFRNNGTYSISGFWSGVSSGMCTAEGSATYSVYDVTISGMLPFVVVYLYSPETPILFDNAACSGSASSLDVYSWNFTPPVQEIISWYNTGTTDLTMSSYNLAVIPPCPAFGCHLYPSFFPMYYFVDVPTSDPIAVEYAVYPNLLPVTWTFNSSTPLRVVLPLS